MMNDEARSEAAHEALLDRIAGCCTRLTFGDGRTSWSFFGDNPSGGSSTTAPAWTRRYSTAAGYHLVARRAVRKGESIVEESSLLAATAPSHNDPGWASASLRAFCAASARTQAAVLGMYAGDGTSSAFVAAEAEAAREVKGVARRAWRVACKQRVSDAQLRRVCLVFHLNAYGCDGANLVGLFPVGCTMNHACDANVKVAPGSASSTQAASAGLGRFIATRDIRVGEALETNYLGESGCAPLMSTPARRKALLASKLFHCVCTRCVDRADPTRHVPCPGCHPRLASPASDHELEQATALDKHGQVHYATPLDAAVGSVWTCGHCRGSWSAEAAMPGPGSVEGGGGHNGRAWEELVEQHVLNLDRQWMEGARWGLTAAKLGADASRLKQERAACTSLLGAARNLYSMVVMALGARHWTTRRSHQIVSEIATMLQS